MLTAAVGCAKLRALALIQVMVEEQLKSFLEAVKADVGLQEKLKAAVDAEAVVVIANAAGFAITFEEYQRWQEEMDDMELESVAGGLRLRVGRRVRSGDDDLDELEVERLRAK